ncbi:hypothetical protein GYA93_06440 [Gordonia desulfuricans]|uniref:Type IV toxin-antitoxin system AbiEi family antitoxin domain-containing protein n=1 Tax=Gordonia desulfuricans TaxID=89051 RepID=A0A7K3LLT9_9ACTN|nr:hypothetical protein [Gordonia desulfuricans]NDK89222.1 hypothetical protein [Gordonia desulfuricans]
MDQSTEITRRAEVLGRVATDRVLQAVVRDGERVRLWPGTFMDWPDHDALSTTERYRITAIESARKGGPNRTLSHVSALAVHHVPMLRPDLRRVHYIASAPTRHTARVSRHNGILLDDEREQVEGVWVTTRERALCDAARLGTFEQAVAMLDAGLRAGADPVLIDATIERLRGHVGVERLRYANGFADARSESVGESFSRALMAGMSDVPTPELQVEIRDAAGRSIGRVDFLIGGVLVGEFDGKVKYSGTLGDDPPSEVVVKEKIREDALRAEGYVVIRWTWEDLLDPRRFRAVLRKGMRAAGLL